MLWSAVSIPAVPTILIVDASRNLEGWESEFCDRLFASMRKRGLRLEGSGPVKTENPRQLVTHVESQQAFNCLLLLGHGKGDGVEPGMDLGSYWSWLNAQNGLLPKLVALCMWQRYDQSLSREVLESPQTFAPLALAPQAPMTPREAGLYFLKFFTELDLHSDGSITGKMVWFSGSKARELLKRRRLTGKVGVRC